MSKLLEKAQKPIGFIAIGIIAVLFSLHPAWLHDRIPLRIYKPIELLSIVLLFSTLIVVSWNYFKDRDTGKVPPWLITTLLAVGLIAGGYFWKGNPLSYFSQKNKLAHNNTVQDSSKNNIEKSDKKTTPTKLTQSAIDSVKAIREQEERADSLKLAQLEKAAAEEMNLFIQDSTERAEAAERKCVRNKQIEDLSIKLEKIIKSREALAKMPIVPSCGDQISTPEKEKETARIASTKSDDRKNDKKLKNKNVGSTFKKVVYGGEL